MSIVLWSIGWGGEVKFLPWDRHEFSPILGQKFSIPISLGKDMNVTVEIYTPDGALIRTLGGDKYLKKGRHLFEWDGKDQNGTVVPDEAYNLVLRAVGHDGNVTVFDPRKLSGGVVQRNLDPRVGRDGKIVYRLESPSRVMIRLGVKGGALLRTLVTWKAKNSGKNIQVWDGYDQDHLIKVSRNRKLEIALAAFSLADDTVLTTGNRALDYFQYCKNRKLVSSMAAKSERFTLAKERKRLSPFYSRTLSSMREPRVLITFPSSLPHDKNGIPVIEKGKKVRVEIRLDKRDEKRMEKVKYEITFFDDLEFIAEEEMGYVPISWVWEPNTRKGKHIFTVNLSSFEGHVGVKSVQYIIK